MNFRKILFEIYKIALILRHIVVKITQVLLNYSSI